METATYTGATAPRFTPRNRPQPVAATFPPLADETRDVLPTADAAHHLLRQSQTLRGWASAGNGPISPVRIGGRLGWRVADIRRLLGVAQ